MDESDKTDKLLMTGKLLGTKKLFGKISCAGLFQLINK